MRNFKLKERKVYGPMTKLSDVEVTIGGLILRILFFHWNWEGMQ